MKRSKNNKFITAGLFLLIMALFSCNNYSSEDAKKYLPGKYLYEFPSGEISILEVHPDFSFNNKIYSKNKKDLLYNNNGKMSVEGNNIECMHMLQFPKHDEFGLIFSKPEIGYSIGHKWVKPIKNENERVIIIMSISRNYVFEKLD